MHTYQIGMTSSKSFLTDMGSCCWRRVSSVYTAFLTFTHICPPTYLWQSEIFKHWSTDNGGKVILGSLCLQSWGDSRAGRPCHRAIAHFNYLPFNCVLTHVGRMGGGIIKQDMRQHQWSMICPLRLISSFCTIGSCNEKCYTLAQLTRS